MKPNWRPPIGLEGPVSVYTITWHSIFAAAFVELVNDEAASTRMDQQPLRGIVLNERLMEQFAYDAKIIADAGVAALKRIDR